jgi:Glycosyl hydrolase catalytic core
VFVHGPGRAVRAARRRALLACAGALLSLCVVAGSASASMCPGGTCPPSPFLDAAPTLAQPANETVPGNTLTGTIGFWHNVETSSSTPYTTTYAITWWRCDANGANCAAIAGATSAAYAVVAADVHHKLHEQVIATNTMRTCPEVCHPSFTVAQGPMSRLVADVDRTPPAVLLSGAAYDQRASGLTGDDYPLHVAASDSAGADHRSGVARIQISVDGTQRYDSGAQACPAGACSLAADYTVKLSDLLDGPDGSHAVSVVATDVAGNVQTIPFVMFYDYGGRPDPYATDADDPLSADELNGAPYAGDPCAADLPECHEPDPDEGTALRSAAAGNSIQYYGLADQNGGFRTYPFAGVLSSSQFLALHMRRLRATVPWDMMIRAQDGSDPTNLDSLQNFQDFYGAVESYNAGHTTKLLILVSFDRHRGASNQAGAMPTPTAYRTAVTNFMTAFPDVHEFSAFNEANDAGHQLSNNPGVAAQLYQQLASVCATKGCTHAVGGEFVDNQSYSQSYLESYIDYLRSHGVALPKVWAWHGYKAFTTSGVTKFRGFLQRIGHRDVWMTEQGGVLRKSGQSIHDAAVANTHLQKILDLPTAANTSAIKRFYAYQWRGNAQYDAGLASRLEDPFATRSLYDTFKAHTNPSNQAPLP